MAPWVWILPHHKPTTYHTPLPNSNITITNNWQAEYQCHRIGQTKPMTVYRLVTKATVDENIFEIGKCKLFWHGAVNLDRSIKWPVHENHISNGNGLKIKFKFLPPLEYFSLKTKSKGIVYVPKWSYHPLKDDNFQVAKGRSIGIWGRKFVVEENPSPKEERGVVSGRLHWRGNGGVECVRGGSV